VAVRRDAATANVPYCSDQVDIGRSEGDLLSMIALASMPASACGPPTCVTPGTTHGVYRASPTGELRTQPDPDRQTGDALEFLSDVEKTLRPALNTHVLFALAQRLGRLRQLTSAGTSRDMFH